MELVFGSAGPWKAVGTAHRPSGERGPGPGSLWARTFAQVQGNRAFLAPWQLKSQGRRCGQAGRCRCEAPERRRGYLGVLRGVTQGMLSPPRAAEKRCAGKQKLPFSDHSALKTGHGG